MLSMFKAMENKLESICRKQKTIQNYPVWLKKKKKLKMERRGKEEEGGRKETSTCMGT